MAFGKNTATKEKEPEAQAQALKTEDVATLPEKNLPATTGGHGAPSTRAARLEEDSGKGVSTDPSDKLVPRIVVLQSQSPQCLRQKPEFIEAARAGDFYLKGSITPLVTGEEGFDFIPTNFMKAWLEFDGPRDEQPNFISRHPDDRDRPQGVPELVKDEDGYDFIGREAHRYSQSREHYGLINGRPFLFPFGGTAHTTSKEWMSLMDGFRLPSGRIEPSYNRKYHITTTPKSNKSGDWYGIKIDHVGEVSDEEYELARTLHKAIEAGAKVAEAPEGAAGDSGEKIPF
jgi:hypothetical protein